MALSVPPTSHHRPHTPSISAATASTTIRLLSSRNPQQRGHRLPRLHIQRLLLNPVAGSAFPKPRLHIQHPLLIPVAESAFPTGLPISLRFSRKVNRVKCTCSVQGVSIYKFTSGIDSLARLDWIQKFLEGHWKAPVSVAVTIWILYGYHADWSVFRFLKKHIPQSTLIFHCVFVGWMASISSLWVPEFIRHGKEWFLAQGFGALLVTVMGLTYFKNFVSGILIFSNNLFRIGDIIVIKKGEEKIYGQVEDFGLFSPLVLRTIRGTILYIPNYVATEGALQNYNKLTHRHLLFRFEIKNVDVYMIEGITKNLHKLMSKIPPSPKKTYPNSITTIDVDVDKHSATLLMSCFTGVIDIHECRNLKEMILLQAWKMIEEQVTQNQ